MGGTKLLTGQRREDVVDPNYIHILRIEVNIKSENERDSALLQSTIYLPLKCAHPLCSTMHPHSNCGDTVAPHYIHIICVKVHVTSTSQAVWDTSFSF